MYLKHDICHLVTCDSITLVKKECVIYSSKILSAKLARRKQTSVLFILKLFVFYAKIAVVGSFLVMLFKTGAFDALSFSSVCISVE